MELQPLQGGREFGFRFLNQIKWAMATFHFRYLLRIDDDYFLCLKKLLAELPMRPNKNLVWGFFHCQRRGKMTWIDEAFMIFTRDIIQTFLAQNESSMLCHPHADQQIGLWLNQITRKIFFHDKRLYHHPPASFSPKFQNITNVCDSYLGVHGTYVDKMRYFGRNANDSAKNPILYRSFIAFVPLRNLTIALCIGHFVLSLNFVKTIPRGMWREQCLLVVSDSTHCGLVATLGK